MVSRSRHKNIKAQHSPIQSITIIGAGIAGLSSALALAQQGFDVTIIEKVKTLSSSGAGIQLSPNATRVLAFLNLLPEIEKVASHPQNITLNDGASKQQYLCLPLNERQNHWPFPYLVIHRADLQKILYDAVLQYSNIHLLFNHQIKHIDTDETQKIHLILDCNQKTKSITCDFLLGCDGVWSFTRQYFYPRETAFFTNYYAWRLSYDVEKLPSSSFYTSLTHDISAWMHKKQHLVIYPISQERKINFVQICRMPSIHPPKKWQIPLQQEHLQKYFSYWHRDFYPLSSYEQWNAWPIFTSKTCRFKIKENIFLLGDAAHAISPFAAQGAAMALEDAMLLSVFLKETIDLKYFEKIRLKRINKIIRRTKINVLAYHAQGLTAWIRNKILRYRPKEHFLHDLDWLYLYDSTQLPQKLKKY